MLPLVLTNIDQQFVHEHGIEFYNMHYRGIAPQKGSDSSTVVSARGRYRRAVQLPLIGESGCLIREVQLSQVRDQVHGLVVQRRKEYEVLSWCILSSTRLS